MQYLQRGLETSGREAVFSSDSGGWWSYGQLLDRTQSVTARLRVSRGWNPGNRVGLFLTRRNESVALLLGIFGAGGIATPFSVRGTAREVAHQIVDAGISHIVLPLENAAQQVLIDAAARAAEQGVVPQLLDAPSLLEKTSSPGALQVDPHLPAMILYTSGTTGQPKGVVHTHASLMAQVDVLHRSWEWSADDRLLHVLPLHHVHGLVNGLLGAIRAGARLVFLSAFEPAEVWNAFASQRISVLYAVPTIYHQLTDAWERQDTTVRRRWADDAARLRLMVSGSAALPARLWNRWREITGQALLERYGMTEIGMGISNPYHGERRPGTVGQPLPGIHVRIVADDGSRAPDGTPGEIQIQGPSLFREYWNQPDATREAFRDGFFLTGDVAEVHDGYICIRGRASVDILKSGGYKLSALEIEEVLREHPAIREAAVVGAPDAQWGEIVTAFVVLAPGQSLALEEVRAWCHDKLASYKLPRRLEVRPELPRNAMGKVVKPDLIRELLN